jgi:hypothetical protein
VLPMSTIVEDPHVARRAFLDYRKQVRVGAVKELTKAEQDLLAIDREMLRAYRELAKGTTLLRLSETIRAGGFETRPVPWATSSELHFAIPKLAVAKATARRCYTTGIDSNGTVRFSSAVTPNWLELSTAKSESVLLREAFGEGPARRTLSGRARDAYSTTVPTVPPQFRPATLRGYHLLFEVDKWDEPPVPADPALLKHVGGDLWAVVATWDLTPLEAAVLGQRR